MGFVSYLSPFAPAVMPNLRISSASASSKCCAKKIFLFSS